MWRKSQENRHAIYIKVAEQFDISHEFVHVILMKIFEDEPPWSSQPNNFFKKPNCLDILDRGWSLTSQKSLQKGKRGKSLIIKATEYWTRRSLFFLFRSWFHPSWICSWWLISSIIIIFMGKIQNARNSAPSYWTSLGSDVKTKNASNTIDQLSYH